MEDVTAVGDVWLFKQSGVSIFKYFAELRQIRRAEAAPFTTLQDQCVRQTDPCTGRILLQFTDNDRPEHNLLLEVPAAH